TRTPDPFITFGRRASFSRSLRIAERLAESLPARDAELHVDVAQVLLDGLAGDKERLGDLRVGVPLAGDASGAQLAGGQRVDAGAHDPAGAGTGREQLLVCTTAEFGRAAAVSE